jgi:hypothetical protein
MIPSPSLLGLYLQNFLTRLQFHTQSALSIYNSKLKAQGSKLKGKNGIAGYRTFALDNPDLIWAITPSAGCGDQVLMHQSIPL